MLLAVMILALMAGRHIETSQSMKQKCLASESHLKKREPLEKLLQVKCYRPVTCRLIRLTEQDFIEVPFETAC
jgi:hypothetical protein